MAQNRQGLNLDINPQRPREPLSPTLKDHEELYEAICEFEDNQIVLFVIRCLTLFSCLIGILLVLVNLFRGNRLKSWRLYFLVAMSVFAWIAMTLCTSSSHAFTNSVATNLRSFCQMKFVHFSNGVCFFDWDQTKENTNISYFRE